MQRIIVVGGGFAGLSVVRRIRSLSKEVEILLVDERAGHMYTPWLYEVATAIVPRYTSSLFAPGRTAAEISFSDISGFDHVRFIKERMVAWDTHARWIKLQSGAVFSCDVLVFALGAVTNDFGIQGVLTYGLPLKTTDHARVIAERFRVLCDELSSGRRSQGTIAVVGGGANGIELVAEIASVRLAFLQEHHLQPHQLRVVLCDAGKELLGKYPIRMRKNVVRRLHALHVEVMTQCLILGVTTSTIEAQGFLLPYDVLIWTAGVRATDIVHAGDVVCDMRGRIRVDDTFSVIGQEGFFALGDCAVMDGRAIPDPQSAQAACAQAKIVAKNIVAYLHKKPLQRYASRCWHILLAVGGSYGAGSVFGIALVGKGAYVLRRLVDLKYFLSVFPVFFALRLWYCGITMYAGNDPQE